MNCPGAAGIFCLEGKKPGGEALMIRSLLKRLENGVPPLWREKLEKLTVVTTDRPTNAYAQIFRYVVTLSSFLWVVLVTLWINAPFDAKKIWILMAFSFFHTFAMMYMHKLLEGSFLRGGLFVLGFLVDTAIAYIAVGLTGGIKSYWFLLCCFCFIDTALYFGNRGSLLLITVGTVAYVAVALATTPGDVTKLDLLNVLLIVAPFFLYFAVYGMGHIESEKAQRELNAKLKEANRKALSLYDFSVKANRLLDGVEIGSCVSRSLKSFFGAEKLEFYLYRNGEPALKMDGEKVEEVAGRAEAPAGLAFHVEDESERYGTIVVDKEDMTGDQVEYLSTFANVAALSLKNSNMVEKLKERANTDYLTGLRNHRCFQERLAEEVERSKRYGTPLSLVMIDIDNFKKFNDTYGHQFGDLALKTVAQTIRGTVRASDLAARYGGEEMAVLLPNTSIEGACAIAGRICENIRRVVVSDGRNAAKVTVSVGVAEFKGDKDRLIREADEALYSAKRSGKDRYVAYAA